MSEQEQLNDLFYFKIIDFWKRFCEFHSDLYDLTCDEYTALLNNSIEQVEVILSQKEDVIAKISAIEKLRGETIQEINKTHNTNISDVSELLLLLGRHPKEKESNLLLKMNSLLIDLIENIRAQNKKNQVFLNKAIMNLDELKIGIAGNKSLGLYDSKGMQNSQTTK